MWPFKERNEAKARDPKPDDWSIGQGERDGFPMIVRIANAYSDLAPLPGYDHHLIVSVHLRAPRPNGFPSSEEADDLEALEIDLCRLLEADNESLCVLVITNHGLRDLIFYTRNAEQVKRKIKNESTICRGFVTDLALEPDAQWEIYRTFRRMMAGRSSTSKVN